MKEELIISGRNIPNIDPYLHIWHWQIPIYLFLGGLAAGILFFASLFIIRGKDKEWTSSVKITPIFAPLALVLGLFALFLDLKHKLYFWQLYTTIRLESPMSWGAWTLMLVTPLSFIWVASYLKEIAPKICTNSKIVNLLINILIKPVENSEIDWEWKWEFLVNFEKFVQRNRVGMAWITIVSSVILGVYTGILLSAFNARPLWNTSVLGILFMTSGFSTAAALNMWLSKNKEERKLFSKFDIVLIIIELFLIVHMFMGFLASTEVQIEAANLFLGGEFTVPFWVFVVGLGLVIPLLLEIMELKGVHIPVAIPALMILIGGLIFRFVMVEAGQITRYLY